LGVYILYTIIVALMGVKFSAEFHPIGATYVAPVGQKTQNRPLSNLNTVALLCAQCCCGNEQLRRCLGHFKTVFYSVGTRLTA